MQKVKSILDKIKVFIFDNIVTIMFLIIVLFGIAVSKNLSVKFFLDDILTRIYRIGFLCFSLVIPIIAGLGLNFGIIVGAIAGTTAIIIVNFLGIGGYLGIMICFLITLPFAILFGFLTGKLYNKTRGQEMIAGLVVGTFTDGIYQFIFLFVIGAIIKIPKNHPMIGPTGVGIRVSFSLGALDNPRPSDLIHILDNMLRIPFVWAIIILSVCMLTRLLIRDMIANKNPNIIKMERWVLILNCIPWVAVIGVAVHAMVTGSVLMTVKDVPVVTCLTIVAVYIFIKYFLKTKLGQDCRAVGQSQYIAQISGIDVDKTRIAATIYSTVIAAWGMIIYLQNLGTINSFTAYKQVDLFAVAALLAGGASVTKVDFNNVFIGIVLFNAMLVTSPEIGYYISKNANIAEYFRSMFVYGVIALSLGLHSWKGNFSK